jgi:hypothetical protein
MLGSTKMITSTYSTSSDGQLAPGWLQSTATCGAPANLLWLGGDNREELERDWETEGGLRSIRVPRRFIRWFYRARRGRRWRHSTGDGRDASVLWRHESARILALLLAKDAEISRRRGGGSSNSEPVLSAVRTWSSPAPWRPCEGDGRKTMTLSA